MNARYARALVAAMLTGTAILLGVSESGASTGPGTPAQVAADVASSLSIKILPSNLSPSLATASKDVATVGTPSLASCNTTGVTLNPSKCVFGDKTGGRTMVLWGDSHAFMWFPAVNAVAKSHHWRLIALLQYACPVATVSVWNPVSKTPYTSCDIFRKNMIKAINKLNPSLVVLSDAFTSQAASGGGAYNTITTAQWKAALEVTLRALHSTKMKKVLIGSTVSSMSQSNAIPPQCLAAQTSSVQACTISDDAAQKAQRAAESTASKATGVRYINVLPWTCSSAATPVSCSPVAGDPSSGYKVVYYSTGHLTETYDLWLGSVLGAALKPSM